MSDPASLAQQLSNAEKRILLALRGSESVALDVLRQSGGFQSEDEAAGAASWLQAKGLAEITETKETLYQLDEDGRRFAREGLPETRLHGILSGRGGRADLGSLGSVFGPEETRIALAWWKRKGLGGIERGASGQTITADAKTDPRGLADEAALQELAKASAPVATVSHAEGLKQLLSRPGIVKPVERRARSVRLTTLGRTVSTQPLAVQDELSQLTPDIIQSGAWRGKSIRPYDVNSPAPRPQVGKPHPLVQIIDEIRDIFLELGFQEIEEEYVVPALWNMDALFIPQDHPAREMQDTFYLDNPASLPIEADIVEKVRAVHEKGGGTGSRGWGGHFDDTEAAHALLRTHTTVGTIRHLAKNPDGPLRVFSIGRVFRKETMDATHLPEFHQIEGIATEPGADFRMLLGTLQEFYRRLGFPKLRWRPAYFPYTEPSMEVEVWTGTKWMELGGCGIFRPEVTLPFGVKTPVLAWGLGLERLAMMRFGLADIRQLYISDLEWLRKQPLL